MTSKRTDKRSRLVEAADQLFYKQGVNVTTLANIAALAEVPLGNVYYYFKSKDSIILAVIERRRKMIQDQLQQWNDLTPVERLKAFIKQNVAETTETASFGDWLGSLCQELCKTGGEISDNASHLFKDILGWCEQQFKHIGKAERSNRLATTLLSGLQGSSLLTLTFKDQKLADEQVNYLITWLESA